MRLPSTRVCISLSNRVSPDVCLCFYVQFSMAVQYKVEEIIDSKVEAGRTSYLVKWKDYPVRDATWEPEANVYQTAKEKVQDYLSVSVYSGLSFA